jgi:transcriptional regulator with XRE-family HTH domain
MTQAQLAELVDVSDETISRIERGAFEPTISTILGIAEALGVSLDALVQSGPASQLRASPSPIVQQLATRAAQLDPPSQRALLVLAQLLPSASRQHMQRRRR